MTVTSDPGIAGLPSSRRLGSTLGTGRGLRRRILLHHVPIAAASAIALVVLAGLSPARRGLSIQHLASPTGDVALLLLGATLLIGPANLLLGKRNPVNNYLRRDVGTWTAIWSVVHVVVGFQGHSAGAFGFLDYFVADGRPLTNSYGMGNWTGLAATVLVVLLLVLSTDHYLRELKARRWKDLQRLNYTLFGLVVLHAIYYGALRRMASPFTRLLLVTIIVVLAGQAAGIWLWRRRSPHQREQRGMDRWTRHPIQPKRDAATPGSHPPMPGGSTNGSSGACGPPPCVDSSSDPATTCSTSAAAPAPASPIWSDPSAPPGE